MISGQPDANAEEIADVFPKCALSLSPGVFIHSINNPLKQACQQLHRDFSVC